MKRYNVQNYVRWKLDLEDSLNLASEGKYSERHNIIIENLELNFKNSLTLIYKYHIENKKILLQAPEEITVLDDLEGDDIIQHIIDETPTTNKVRKLLKQYVSELDEDY